MAIPLRNFVGLALIWTCVALPSRAAGDEKVANRYPYDPACPWGRLSDGRGIIVRCLTEAEVAQLSAPRLTAPSNATPATSAETTNKKSPGDEHADAVDVDVVSVTADEGTLPIARRKLRVPRDKYAHCVAENGGLAGESGEVTVRFLVRERGRAEGTSVEKHVGVSEAAAKCIAAVVDRRPVGTPEGPAVGATAVLRVSKLAKRRAESTTGH